MHKKQTWHHKLMNEVVIDPPPPTNKAADTWRESKTKLVYIYFFDSSVSLKCASSIYTEIMTSVNWTYVYLVKNLINCDFGSLMNFLWY